MEEEVYSPLAAEKFKSELYLPKTFDALWEILFLILASMFVTHDVFLCAYFYWVFYSILSKMREDIKCKIKLGYYLPKGFEMVENYDGNGLRVVRA